MKRLWILMGLLLTGCSTSPEMTSFFQKESVLSSDLDNIEPTTTVSMMLPLSGTWAATGESFQKASLLALNDTPNASVRILFFDTQSTPEGTLKAYNDALEQNPDIILGPIFADEFKALPSPSFMNKPVLGYTSDNTLLNSERTSFAVLIPEQIREIVRQNCLDGKKEIAVIGPEGKTGEIVMNALDESIKQCPGMTLKTFALYDAKKQDMSEDILKILPTFINPKKKDLTEKEKELLEIPMEERLKFDSLLVFEEGTKLTQVMSILAFYDVTPKIIPIYTLSSAKSLKDNSLNGVMMADLPANNIFNQTYKNAFSKNPIRLSSLAYDSVSWIAKESLKGPVSLKGLQEAEPHQGVDGLVALKQDGTNKRGLRLVRKTARGVVEVAPAPTDLDDRDFMLTIESTDSALESPDASVESPEVFQQPILYQPLF